MTPADANERHPFTLIVSPVTDALTAVTIPESDPPLPALGPDERWCSVELAAKLLGLSTPTIRRRIRAGEPPFRLPDGSSWPVESERIVRPQGSYFVLKLPAGLEPLAPSVEAGSTEDLTTPDRSSDDEQASPSPVTPEEEASGVDRHPSVTPSDASTALIRELVADLVGELRARSDGVQLELARVTRALDASQSETIRVTAAYDAYRAETEATRQLESVTLREAQDRRLAAEAALLALSAREDSLTAREQAVAATEARLGAMGLWARLRWLLGL